MSQINEADHRPEPRQTLVEYCDGKQEESPRPAARWRIDRRGQPQKPGRFCRSSAHMSKPSVIFNAQKQSHYWTFAHQHDPLSVRRLLLGFMSRLALFLFCVSLFEHIFRSAPLFKCTHMDNVQTHSSARRLLSEIFNYRLAILLGWEWESSLPISIIHLHCSTMTNVHKAYWQPSSCWLAVILCSAISEMSLFSCHSGGVLCCNWSDALIWRTRCDWISYHLMSRIFPSGLISVVPPAKTNLFTVYLLRKLFFHCPLANRKFLWLSECRRKYKPVLFAVCVQTSTNCACGSLYVRSWWMSCHGWPLSCSWWQGESSLPATCFSQPRTSHPVANTSSQCVQLWQ